ncbi:uncharacterized protein LOC131930241 [Physella acuta]|uniref:uncharacterized protein LOC131930241 n=1 Tax=Physella acuta TaxID=109671 RepID=UPI0027DE109B|nr:uncharacterized protein LOC131930241 [Physella acuta]
MCFLSRLNSGIDFTDGILGSRRWTRRMLTSGDIENYFTGSSEVEFYEDNDDLQDHYLLCQKNPGHPKFIPVPSFTLQHLPSRYHDGDMMALMKALITITVKINVNFNSIRRPQYFPNTTNEYPFYFERGKFRKKTGSGVVRRAHKLSPRDKITCNCRKCKDSGNPKIACGKFEIHTATHVVFDQSEVESSTIHFFYDSPDSPFTELNGGRIVIPDISGDWTQFVCLTCDEQLFETIYSARRRFNDLREVINEKYEKFVDEDKLAVIVSHPHGRSKCVSVGRWELVVNEHDSLHSKYAYSTCTCPGSSGAYVYMIGDLFTTYTHVHSGSNPHCNFSGKGGFGSL